MSTKDPKRTAFVLGILSLVVAAGAPILVLLMRMGVFTFNDDFTGFNALGFALTWLLVLLLTSTVLAALAWRADRRSWLSRFAFGINGLLLAGVIWLFFTLGW